MSNDDTADPYTPEERKALRGMLRDVGAVKDLFNQNREIFSNAMEQMKYLKTLNPDPSSMDEFTNDLKMRLDLNDMIEALAPERNTTKGSHEGDY